LLVPASLLTAYRYNESSNREKDRSKTVNPQRNRPTTPERKKGAIGSPWEFGQQHQEKISHSAPKFFKWKGLPWMIRTRSKNQTGK